MKYLEPAIATDPSSDERELEELLTLVQPGWKERTTARRFLPRLVSTNALVEASTLRPEVDATGIEGAFIAGDWVGPEGMLLDAALASAREASNRAIRRARGLGAHESTPAGGMAAQ